MRKRPFLRKVWPGDVLGDDQQVRVLQLQLGGRCNGHRGQRIEAGQRQLARFDDLHPRRQYFVVGQRAEQEAIVLAFALVALLQRRRVVLGRAVELLQLALDQLLAVVAGGVRQRLEPVVLVDRVDRDVDRRSLRRTEELLEPREPRLGVLEALATGDLALPAGHRGAGGGDADQDAGGHGRCAPAQIFRLPIIS
jgi:predicted HTH domain antitoxin